MSANIPWHRGVTLLKKHESGIIAINKPAGLLSHPNDRKSTKQSIVVAEFDKKNECFDLDDGSQLYLCNRLDSPTSGIVILASHLDAKTQLDQLFRENKIKKTYYALVKGNIRGKSELWEDRLKTDKGKNLRTDRSTQGFVSKTKVKIIKSTYKTPIPISLLELQPLTGRTHQLRVQSSLRKVPIVGDKTYGDFKTNRLLEKTMKLKRLCLHARLISIPLSGGKSFNVSCPSDFEDII